MKDFKAAILIAFIAVSLFTKCLAAPVPELSVKLLCELLCEHCNGVSNMESGNCNCEVPEAHFKDNSACLERVQISAAEMNLKLTHTSPDSNRRRKRCADETSERVKISNTAVPTIYNLLKVPRSQILPTSVSSDVVADFTAIPLLPLLPEVDATTDKNQLELDLAKDSPSHLTTPSFGQIFSKKGSAAMSSRKHFDSEPRAPKLVYHTSHEKNSHISHKKYETKLHKTVNAKEDDYSTDAKTNSDSADNDLSKLPPDHNDCGSALNEKLRNKLHPPTQHLLSDDRATNIFQLGQKNHQIFMNHLKSLLSSKLTEAKFKNPSIFNQPALIVHNALDSNTNEVTAPINLLDKMNSLNAHTKPDLVNFNLLNLPKLPLHSELDIPSEKEHLDLRKMNDNIFGLTPFVPHEYPKMHLPSLFPAFGIENGPKSAMQLPQDNRVGYFDLLGMFPKHMLVHRLDPLQNKLISDLAKHRAENRMNLWPGQTQELKFSDKLNNDHSNFKNSPLQTSYNGPFSRNNQQSRIPVTTVDSSSSSPSKDLPSIHSETQNPAIICEHKSDTIDDTSEAQRTLTNPRKFKQKYRVKEVTAQQEEKLSESLLGVSPAPYYITVNDNDIEASLNTNGDAFVLTTLPLKRATNYTQKVAMNTDYNGVSSSVTELPIKETSDYEKTFITFPDHSEFSDTSVQIITEQPTTGATEVRNFNNYKHHTEQFLKQSEAELSMLVSTTPSNIKASSEKTVQTESLLPDDTTSTLSTLLDASVLKNIFYQSDFDVSQNPPYKPYSDSSQNPSNQPHSDSSQNPSNQPHSDSFQNLSGQPSFDHPQNLAAPLPHSDSPQGLSHQFHFHNFQATHQHPFNRSQSPSHQLLSESSKNTPYKDHVDSSQIHHLQPHVSSPHYPPHEPPFERYQNPHRPYFGSLQNPSHQPYFDSSQQPYHHLYIDSLRKNSLQHYPTNYLSSVYGPNTHGKYIPLSLDGNSYPVMVYPTTYNNDMQRADYPALLSRNEFSNTEQDSVLSRPTYFIPRWTKPLDQPSHLMSPVDGEVLTHPSAGRTGIVMSALVPSEPLTPSYSHSQDVFSQPITFILKPFSSPNGNIPFPDFLNQLRNGNAILQVQPINLNDIEKYDRE